MSQVLATLMTSMSVSDGGKSPFPTCNLSLGNPFFRINSSMGVFDLSSISDCCSRSTTRTVPQSQDLVTTFQPM